MAYRLRDNLYWCLSGGRAVFLDVERDRYFCLSGQAGAVLTGLGAGAAAHGNSAILRPLIARGLLVEDPFSPGLSPASSFEPATGDFLEEPFPSPGLLQLAGAFAAELRAAWLLHSKPFLQVLEGVEKDRTDRLPPPADLDERLRAIVSAALGVSLVLRATDRCLVRALAVHSVCRRRGIYPKLVFGVRMNPFGAHCWVQLDSRVLVGDFEQVRLFEPIAAFG